MKNFIEKYPEEKVAINDYTLTPLFKNKRRSLKLLNKYHENSL